MFDMQAGLHGGTVPASGAEHYRQCADRPEEDEERLVAAIELALALWRNGELKESRQLGIETLPIVRRVYGHEHDLTLSAMSRLAGVHADMKDQ